MKHERLIYLSTILTLPELPKVLQRYVPLYDVIQGIQTYGIVGVSTNLESVPDQLMGMVRKGKQAGETGTIAEYKAIIADMVYHGVESSNLTGKEKIELYAILDQWVKEKQLSLVEKKATSFDKRLISEKGQKDFIFGTGFIPLDTLTSGIPSNSLVLFLAHTGAGKTSVMLSLANSLSYYYRVVYISYEMSEIAVWERTQYLNNLCAKDVLLTGAYTLDEIREYIDGDTIIFVDYISKVPHSEREERLRLSKIASELASMAISCKAVITAQQAKRGQSLSLEAGAESWAVTHDAALVLGITQGGNDYSHPGYKTVELDCFKNRYGKSGTKVIFPFNYANLAYEQVSVSGDARVDYDANW
jgi:predicted ATP-dependent serine protease